MWNSALENTGNIIHNLLLHNDHTTSHFAINHTQRTFSSRQLAQCGHQRATQGHYVQELNLQPICCGWLSANTTHAPLPLFSEAGEKLIQLRQVDCHPCRKMSKCKWETAKQDVSQVTLAASSDIHELISLQKGKVDFFFLACYTTTCHIWECLRKKQRGTPRPCYRKCAVHVWKTCTRFTRLGL